MLEHPKPKRTPLYAEHLALKARMVEFGGWEMPLHYGSQIEEHMAVRQYAGIFDVSHMTIVDILGNAAQDFLLQMFANDIGKLSPGKALYTCMLNSEGGIVDDLIVYMFSEKHYRLVLNAATREKDLNCIYQQQDSHSAILADIQIQPRDDLAMIALQGPHSVDIFEAMFGGSFVDALSQLKPFEFILSADYLCARTGYTGEDGFEIMLPASMALALWHKLLGAGARPIGLGARDSLRLEAGFNLYGMDMDESITPLECNLAWTVAFQPESRDFVGRKALERVQRAVQEGEKSLCKMAGLVLNTGGVLRHGQTVFCGDAPLGVVTSGSFSPIWQASIGFARICPQKLTLADNNGLTVDIRGRRLPVHMTTKPVFVRHGKKL